jgi:KaiC/GvpD/RAD55 family RecA-like ATPase
MTTDATPSELVAMLGGVPLLSGLTRSQLESIVAVGRTQSFRAGETIVREGEKELRLYLLLVGTVEVRQSGRAVASLAPGQFFGEAALLVDQPRTAEVRATSEARCLVLDRWDFWGAMGVDPERNRALYEGTLQRLRTDLSGPPPATGDGTATPETLAAPVLRRFPERLPTGTPRLDDLLLGGLPPNGHVALLGDALVGKEVVLYAFIAEGLKRGEPAILVTAVRSPSEIAQSLRVILPQFHEYEQTGMVRWVDASEPGRASEVPRTVVPESDERATLLTKLVQVVDSLEEGRPRTLRVGFLGLSSVLVHGDDRSSFSFLQSVVGALKPRLALAMYSLERGALSETLVETILSRMDGAIVFRQDRDHTFLSVKGFGEVQTRDWVECRTTPHSLILGSFSLERIR